MQDFFILSLFLLFLSENQYLSNQCTFKSVDLLVSKSNEFQCTVSNCFHFRHIPCLRWNFNPEESRINIHINKNCQSCMKCMKIVWLLICIWQQKMCTGFTVRHKVIIFKLRGELSLIVQDTTLSFWSTLSWNFINWLRLWKNNYYISKSLFLPGLLTFGSNYSKLLI